MKKEVPVEKAYRLINHGCVVLVTSAYKDRANVMTLAWQTPLAVKPPLIGIVVAAGHLTHELISASEEFALNIPASTLLPAVQHCGKFSGRSQDKFQGAGLTPVTARKIRAPLIAECLGHLECGVVNRHRVGDHSLFVGEILAASVEEELFSDHWEEIAAATTIHHLGGNHYCFSGSCPDSPAGTA